MVGLAGPVDFELAQAVEALPGEKVLPSGDSVWTFRLVVPRVAPYRRKQTVDALECAVCTGRIRRSVAGWRR